MLINLLNLLNINTNIQTRWPLSLYRFVELIFLSLTFLVLNSWYSTYLETEREVFLIDYWLINWYWYYQFCTQFFVVGILIPLILYYLSLYIESFIYCFKLFRLSAFLLGFLLTFLFYLDSGNFILSDFDIHLGLGIYGGNIFVRHFSSSAPSSFARCSIKYFKSSNIFSNSSSLLKEISYEQYLEDDDDLNIEELDNFDNVKLPKGIRILEPDYTLFDNIKNIIETSPINHETELEIEYILLNKGIINSKHKSMEKFSINYELFNKKLKNLLINEENELNIQINHFRKNKIIQKKSLSKNEIRDNLTLELLEVIKNDFIISILYGRLIRLLSCDENLKNSIILFCDIGKELVNHYFYSLYELEKRKKNYNYISDWKENNKNILDKFSDNTFIHNLGALFFSFLKKLDLVTEELIPNPLVKKQNITIVNVSEKILDTLDNKVIYYLPTNLPMIVKPKPYFLETKNGKEIERLGGYLLNDERMYNELIISKWNLKYQSCLNNDNIIYSSINSMSNVGYKINKDVLYFIVLNSSKYEFIDNKFIHSLIKNYNNKGKLYKYEKKELDSILSKKYVQDNVIAIAKIYENIHEFFIPLRIDYRGRIYCISDYLNYQSTELAKSLLLFSKGEKVSKSDQLSINYLKIYGANCFGLDKLSWKDRVKWVDNNENKIRNFMDFELITKAESKYLFTAFCFEYNKYLNSLENDQTFDFETFLPIQLDATCNGYQHLSMLSLDLDLANQLNLTKSNYKDTPNDFYSFIVKLVKNYINTRLNKDNLDEKERDSLNRLNGLNMQRNLVKKTVMTIPYNASKFRIIEQLKESFVINQELSKFGKKSDKNLKNNENNKNENKKKKDNTIEIWYKHMKYDKVNLKGEDFNLLCDIIFLVLYKHFSNLKILIDYFKEIANVLNQLNLSIPWVLPSGIKVNQSYLKIKDTRIKPFSYSNKSFKLKKIVENKLNNSKQVRSFMPNLIHSLDGCSLTILIDRYFKQNDNKYRSIYAIHDCFGVTCNNVIDVINLLKLIYINIYGDIGYLKKLDDEIKHYIKIHIGEDFDEVKLQVKIVKEDEKIIKYPDINKVISNNNFDINELHQSFYIIN